MAYRTKIIADSIGPNGVRLTTWELTYPRFVHSELLTHRLFSRNSASSRAIPTAKLMEQVKNDPAMPKWWGKNQAGMQAREELTGEPREESECTWLQARDNAVAAVEALGTFGLHKQIANRILEPWMFITVIVTATEWDNWYRLRDHADAQPEIGWVAHDMRAKYDVNVPEDLGEDDWHLPLITLDDIIELTDEVTRAQLTPEVPAGGLLPTWQEVARKISVARCARVSYLTHDGRKDYQEDVKLHDRLAASGHWSPFEHIAQAQLGVGKWESTLWSGNFKGWTQYRETLDPTFTKVGR